MAGPIESQRAFLIGKDLEWIAVRVLEGGTRLARSRANHQPESLRLGLSQLFHLSNLRQDCRLACAFATPDERRGPILVRLLHCTLLTGRLEAQFVWSSLASLNSNHSIAALHNEMEHVSSSSTRLSHSLCYLRVQSFPLSHVLAAV